MLGAAVVASWRIVGPGYLWLTGGTALVVGIPAALAGDQPAAWVGVAAALVVIVRARFPRHAAAGGVLGALAFGAAAALGSSVPAAVTGTLFLGGVTAEMMLGHWYLVDPRLPRWALRRLVAGAAIGGTADLIVLLAFGAIPWSPGDAAAGIGFIVLFAVTFVLLAAVVGALREEGYSGVMAATGLSYLGLLTAIGASVVGRMLVSGPVLS
jgi:hypothetical protein